MDSNLNVKLRGAARGNKVDEIRNVLEINENIDGEYLSELLVLTSYNGHRETVEYLLSLDCVNVTYKDKTINALLWKQLFGKIINCPRTTGSSFFCG